MRTKYTSKLSLLFSGILIALGVLFAQCTKDPTQGQIKVVRLDTGAAASGATVRLFIDGGDPALNGFFLCNEGFTTERTYTADSQGMIDVCFDLPSLVSIEVTYNDGTVGMTGTGKLNLIEHETTTVTVKVN